MSHRKLFAVVLAAIAGVSPVVCGCGGPLPDLAYNKGATSPVVLYREFKAIAPTYLPDAPQTIIYGDGMAIKRTDVYRYESGAVSGGVGSVLKALGDFGFFGFKKEYKGEPLPGGTTQRLKVWLKAGVYESAAPEGQGPSGWEDCVKTVKEVEVTESTEYFPREVVLHANLVTFEVAPNSFEYWPGGDELDRAANAGIQGLVLKGTQARQAWRAIQQAAGNGAGGQGPIWHSDTGQYFSEVYADPVFPNIPTPGS